MDKKLIDIIMNPVRQRIVQYLAVHEKGTVREMREDLSDIPAASLYRHIKILLEGGCIVVLEEKKVRGTMEKTYGLVQNLIGGEPSREDVALLVQSMLISLMSSFQKYFAGDEIDMVKDMLSASTSTLLLTDEEFMEMMGKIGGVMNDYILNKPAEGRKMRRFSFISSPCEE